MTKIQRQSLLLALCLATILTGALFYYLNLKSLNSAPLVKVVVATTNIPANTVLNEKQLKEASIPLKFLLPEALVKRDEIIGKLAKVDIIAGEQIVKSRIQFERKQEGLAGNLPPGYRGVTLKVDAVSGVNHKINIGDCVDILQYYHSTESPMIEKVNTLFQGVEVIEVSGEPGSENQFITLLFTPEEAEGIFLADVTGQIRLTLRPTEDKEPITLYGASFDSIRW